MTREKAGELIENAIREAWRIYKTYNPNGKYLHMTVTRDHVTANNEYWDADKQKPLDLIQPLRKVEGQ